MHYQLITTVGPSKNPGDAFIRIGVEHILKARDPEATFILTCKETDPKIEAADKRIWCGMPLLWHIGEHNTRTIDWWPFLLEFAALPGSEIWGAGSCVGKAYDPELIRSMAAEILCPVTSRDHLLAELTGWELARCPAFYSIPVPQSKTRKLCNWHPSGGHFALADMEEHHIWMEHESHFVEKLAPPQEGWEYVAHDIEEVALGQRLGYSIIHHGTPEYLLHIYATCTRYVGNRVHGAIAARAGGCTDVRFIGWESRMYAVSHPNEPRMWFYPSEVLATL